MQTQDFDAGVEIAALSVDDPEVGAVATFIGRVRGASVEAMTLEHYPGMTERTMEAIVAQAKARWSLRRVCVIHRIGTLPAGAQIVFVGVSSAHRNAAFAACAFIMDILKTQAPFWKKERSDQGAAWVSARDGDEEAARRWNGDPAQPLIGGPHE